MIYMDKQRTANIEQRKARHYIKELAQILLGRQGQSTLRAQLVRGASGTFALKVASTGLVFATSVVLARLLGAKGYGAYAYAISCVSLLSVPAVMGLDVLLTREVARYRTQSDWGSLRGILRWSDRVVLLVSLGLTFLAAGVVWFLRGRLEPQTAAALWISIAILPFLGFILLRQGALQGLGHVVEAQLPQMLILPVLFLVLVGSLYFIFGGLTAPWAVGMRAVAVGIAFLVGTMLLKKHLPRSAKESPREYHRRQWLRSAFPLLFVGAAGIVNQQISIVMLGTMLGPEAAGIYDVARRGAALVTFVLMAVNMPLAPIVASLYTRGEKDRLQRVVTRSARVALLGCVPVALGLIIFGHWILLFFGKEFTGGSNALAILSLGQLVNAGMGSVGLLLNMTGHEGDTARGVGVAAVLNIILSAALIPSWGVYGAAAADAISTATWNILLAVWVYKRLGIYSTALGRVKLGGLL